MTGTGAQPRRIVQHPAQPDNKIVIEPSGVGPGLFVDGGIRCRSDGADWATAARTASASAPRQSSQPVTVLGIALTPFGCTATFPMVARQPWSAPPTGCQHRVA